ncbi:multidrug effflux MFS transporter [Paraburkholderia acidicola]|uniref:Bcr/CflA family efflux transporter n=1 Tax=Paraburkholderia acidicola TaxID=1912599 RepID=A0ABV1LUZ6_9BURK
MTPEERKRLVLIILLVVLSQMTIDIYLPSAPEMVHVFSATQQEIQFSIAIFLFGYGGSQIIYGPLSDYHGRRPVLLFGLVLFLLSTIGIVLSTNVTVLQILRATQGIALGATSVCARAIMRDSFQPAKLPIASSSLAMAWALVPILAPTVGGYLQAYFGWRASFCLLIAFGFVLALFIYLRMPETLPRPRQDIRLLSLYRAYGTLFENPAFRSNVILLALLFGIFSLVNVACPFVLQVKYQLAVTEYGWAMLFISCGYLIGSTTNNRIARKRDPVTIIGYGMGILIVAVTANQLLSEFGRDDLLTLILTLFFIYMSLGMIFPSSLSSCLRPFVQNAGTASAMYGLIVFCAGFAISSLYVYGFVVSRQSLDWVLMISAFLMLACFLFYVRPARRLS